jgi:hypothetical protein
VSNLCHERDDTTAKRANLGVFVTRCNNNLGDGVRDFCFAFIFAGRNFSGAVGIDGEDSSLLGIDFASFFDGCSGICEKA